MRSEPSEILTTPKYPHQHISTAYRVLSAPGKGYAEREETRRKSEAKQSLRLLCQESPRWHQIDSDCPPSMLSLRPSVCFVSSPATYTLTHTYNPSTIFVCMQVSTVAV